MFREKIKPTLVLVLICVIVCLLLAAAYQAAYKDNTGIVTDEIIAGLEDIYGFSDGFEILKNEDGTVKAYEGVTAVISDFNGNTAYEITADGYNSDSIHLLIGFGGDNSVKKIYVLGLNETPGLGTKVQDEGFLSQFTGLKAGTAETDASTGATENAVNDGEAKAVWGTKEEIEELKAALAGNARESGFELDAVTGATYSSQGVYNAVLTALAASENEAGGNTGG